MVARAQMVVVPDVAARKQTENRSQSLTLQVLFEVTVSEYYTTVSSGTRLSSCFTVTGRFSALNYNKSADLA